MSRTRGCEIAYALSKHNHSVSKQFIVIYNHSLSSCGGGGGGAAGELNCYEIEIET